MKKIAPFIPIIGVFLVLYYVKNNEFKGFQNIYIFLITAFIQAISFTGLFFFNI